MLVLATAYSTSTDRKEKVYQGAIAPDTYIESDWSQFGTNTDPVLVADDMIAVRASVAEAQADFPNLFVIFDIAGYYSNTHVNERVGFMTATKKSPIARTSRLLNLSIKDLPVTTVGVALTALVAVLPSPVQAITFVSERAALGSNDQIDWSSLGPVAPFNILPNSFSAKSEGGLGLSVEIPPAKPGLSPPLVFQTLPFPGIETNFASGDFILLTGATLNPPPLDGNPGPLSITFDQPVLGAGTQIAVGRTLERYTAFISAFDNANQELGTFSLDGTSSLALDNSAIFLGVRSDTPNIKRLVFSSSVPDRPLGINTLSVAAVPESSSTLGLLAFGALGAGFVLKRKLDFKV